MNLTQSYLGGLHKCPERFKEINHPGKNATPKDKNLLTILELAVKCIAADFPAQGSLWESDATRFRLRHRVYYRHFFAPGIW
jgi:DNA polymerase III alpha subunit (gram-positive type)